MAWRKNLFAVTAATFIGFTGFTLVMPFLPLYFQQLGVTDVGEIALWSGLSLGVTPAVTALMAPFWGRLADRFGRKIMIERSLASFVIVMAAMGFVTQAWHVFALRALQGLFAGYGALALTMAADSAPRDRMAFAIGTVQTAQRLGPALGPVIGGAVAQTGRPAARVPGDGRRSTSWRWSSCSTMYHERRAARTPSAEGEARITFRNVLALENFVLLMAVVFGLQFVDRSFGPVLPLYRRRAGNADRHAMPILSGVLFSISAGAGAVGNHLCARAAVADARRARVIAGSAAVAAVGHIARTCLPAASASLMFGTPSSASAIGAASTAAYTAAGAVIPPEARGAGFGLLTTGSLMGLAMSPIVCGLLGDTEPARGVRARRRRAAAGRRPGARG